jgi:hypothetical protein
VPHTQPLPFNGFVVKEEEDEDDVMSDDLSVKDLDASGMGKAPGVDDSARSGSEGLDVETGKVRAGWSAAQDCCCSTCCMIKHCSCYVYSTRRGRQCKVRQ